jgi:DNA-directed RNA polymerase specialized sigma24 family protein
MTEENAFQDLIRRVRAGDPEAAPALVRRYEPAIRRIVRLRLRDRRLRRSFDSLDICQSVLHSFFARAALGQFDFHRPKDLLNLLAKMAQWKLGHQVEHEQAQRRDHRRLVDLEGQPDPAVAGNTPSQIVAAKDLLQEVRKRLSEEELRLVDLRALGREWEDIARELGGNPASLRKKLARALDRVARELGLDELSQE